MEFQFTSFMDFLTMNGHGVYVWACYIITAIALIALIARPAMKKRALFIQLKRQLRIENQHKENANQAHVNEGNRVKDNQSTPIQPS